MQTDNKQYSLKYWFEHGTGCLWANDNITQDKYGYSVDYTKLPISDTLINSLNLLNEEYIHFIDWDCPSNPSPWSEENKLDFIQRANLAYHLLCNELGENYVVINEVSLEDMNNLHILLS